MVNISDIWVKVVAPEKPLEVNTIPKYPDANCTVYIVSKYLCVDVTICDIQK